MPESMTVENLARQLSASDANQAREALGEVQALIASGDNSKVEKAQRVLQAAGYYNAGIDGDPGAGTQSAVQALRQDISTRGKQSLERARLENETPLIDAAKEYGPAALGLPAGYIAGGALNRKFRTGAEATAEEAADLAGRRDIDPRVADKVARRRGMYARGMTSELGKRMALPGVFLGGAEFTEQQAEANPELAEFLGPLAVGERYAALGAATQGVKGAMNRPQPSSAVDEATLRSRAAEARRQRPGILSRIRGAQQPQPPAQGTLPEAPPQQQVAGPRAGPKASSPAAATRSALAKIAGRGGNLAIPFAAGGLAYDTATQPSEAAQGEVSPTQQAQGIGAGVTAAGGTYAGMKGMERLGGTLARYAPWLTRAAGGVLSGLGPGMAAADTNQFLAERMTEAGGDPLSAAISIPGAIAGHVSDTASSAREDFEDALQEFMTLLSEIKQGSADQIPRRPGPQL